MPDDAYGQLKNVFQGLGRRACPIFREHPSSGKTDLVGTGVPVRDDNYAALITATHVLTELGDQELVIGGSRGLIRLPQAAVAYTFRPEVATYDVDVAAIALPRKVVEELSGFYRFTTPTGFGEIDTFDKLTLYAFVGYPHSKNKSKPKSFAERRVQPYFYATNGIANFAEVTTVGHHEAIHAEFHADLARMMGPEWQPMQAPTPQGISGCGVWKVSFDQNTGVESAPTLVGIGIEYLRSRKILVATRIGAAAVAIEELFRRIDSGEVLDRLDIHLAGPTL